MRSRITFRGVTAAFAAAGFASFAAAVGVPVALATSASAEGTAEAAALPLPHFAAARTAVVDWHLVNARPPAAPPSAAPPAPAPAVRPSPTEASRDEQRAADPRDVARAMVAARWGDAAQFDCLDALWTKESHWTATETNPSSGAYGIPQALPASKMAWAGDDWRTNPVTQIRWGLHYIADRYGSPCVAWQHSQSYNFY